MTAEEIKQAEEEWWMHTKPVARSLAILDRAGILVYVEGATKGMSLYPFTVKISEPLNDGYHFICKRTELHKVAALVEARA